MPTRNPRISPIPLIGINSMRSAVTVSDDLQMLAGPDSKGLPHRFGYDRLHEEHPNGLYNPASARH